jgi:hypothetical protein
LTFDAAAARQDAAIVTGGEHAGTPIAPALALMCRKDGQGTEGQPRDETLFVVDPAQPPPLGRAIVERHGGKIGIDAGLQDPAPARGSRQPRVLPSANRQE